MLLDDGLSDAFIAALLSFRDFTVRKTLSLNGSRDTARFAYRKAFLTSALSRPGSDLLFHALRRSTIGAEGFHGRVRNGIGCFAPRHSHQTG